MLRGFGIGIIALCVLAGAGGVRAEEDLEKVFPGVMLTDVEMSQLRGTGQGGLGIVCSGEFDSSSCIGSGVEVNVSDNSTNTSLNTIDQSFEFADGILTITQFTGDGNRVDVFISLEVNLNRVTVGDGNTAVTVTQSLDFGNLSGNLSNLVTE